jgi:hypothetical protein
MPGGKLIWAPRRMCGGSANRYGLISHGLGCGVSAESERRMSYLGYLSSTLLWRFNG